MDLRSLYNWFNPEEEERKRELYLLSLRGGNPKYMDGAYPLVDKIQNKQNTMQSKMKPMRPSLQEEERADYGALDWMYNQKHPPKYPGSL